jgi:hypothetical protein
MAAQTDKKMNGQIDKKMNEGKEKQKYIQTGK